MQISAIALNDIPSGNKVYFIFILFYLVSLAVLLLSQVHFPANTRRGTNVVLMSEKAGQHSNNIHLDHSIVSAGLMFLTGHVSYTDMYTQG